MEPQPTEPVSIDALTVVYKNAVDDLHRMVEAFDNSARVGKAAGSCAKLVVALGDASPEPVLTDEILRQWRAAFTHLDEIVYRFFDDNTGTSKGQNALSRETDSDFVLLYNPDVVPDARALWRLAALFNDPTVGLAEAKQLPVSHPKDFDFKTGRTSWGSGAFSLVRRSVFEELGGFDEKTFFLYCDDVDLSWRIRELGLDAVHQPAAVVFHHKELGAGGTWVPTDAERYYSAEAALLLAHKWSQDELLEELLQTFKNSGDKEHAKARKEFLRRQEAGELVAQHDPDHEIGQFIDGNYAKHRYGL